MFARFSYILRYNCIESICYQGALLLHQIMLFSTLDHALYGVIATLFSLVYMGIIYANGGLDITLPPLFHEAKSSKGAFASIILRQYLVQALLVGASIPVLYLVAQKVCSSFSYPIATSAFIWCSLLFSTESLKKTAKSVLQLALHVRTIALVEVCLLLIYISTVWTRLYLGYPVTIDAIFAPLVLLSCISVIIFSLCIYRYYRSLPDDGPQPNISYRSIIHKRIKNYSYQLSHIWYSGNFLVPVFATMYSLQLAGLLKIVSMSAYAINSILQHICGVTSSVLMAQYKDTSKEQKQYLMSHMHRYLFQIICIIALAIAMHSILIPHLYPAITKDQWYMLYLFLLLMLSENILIPQERLLIMEDKTSVLIGCNGVLMLLLYLLAMMMNQFCAYTILSILLIMRIATFAVLHLYARYMWQTRLPWQMRPWYVSASVASALIYLLWS